MSTGINDDGVSHLNTEEIPDLDEGFFQECDKEHDTWSGKDMDVTDILARIRETGGVNQDIAIQMESLEPGVLESKHLTHLHFTRDYTRTNLTLSQEALEDMSQGAKIAIAVGVGTFVAALIAWILSKVFGEDEDGGSGGGGSGGGSGIKDRDLDGRKRRLAEDYKTTHTILQDIASTEHEMKKKLDAKAEELGWNRLMTEVGAGSKDFTLDNAINKIYRKHLYKHFCPLINELINKPTPHVTLAHHLVTNIPKWTREIASKQNQLFHKDVGEVNVDNYKIVFQLPSGLPINELSIVKMLQHYRETMVTPDKNLPFPEFSHIEHANFLESVIKDLDKNQTVLLKDMQGELEAFVTTLKSAPDELAKKQAAIEEIRRAYRELGAAYQVLVTMTNKCDEFLKDLEAARGEKVAFLNKTCDAMMADSESPEQKSAWKSFKEKVKAAADRFKSK